jgi:hypothetical protein
MKTIDVNVIPNIVTGNTQLISKVGANVGTQIFKVDVRLAWPCVNKNEFEAEKKKYDTGEKKGFILNRSPRRLIAKNILIAGVCLVKDVDDDVCIAINPHDDGTADMILPINEHTLDVMGKTTADAVSEAIKGEKDHFFLDGKVLVAIINAAMKKEIQYLEEHIEVCKKMVATLKGDISMNEKKAQDVADAWNNSPLPVNVEMPAGVNGTNVHLTVNDTTV